MATTADVMGEQRAFPVCGCRYCPNAHLRSVKPYCTFGDGEEWYELPTPLIDGVFPAWCPLTKIIEVA